MSSDAKDARWQLAYDMVEAAGIEWEHLGYTQHQQLLDIGQSILDDAPQRVEGLARRWRAGEKAAPDTPSQATGTAYLEKHTMGHAWFGTLGDEVASIVITKPAWIALGKPNSLDVVVRATPDSTGGQ